MKLEIRTTAVFSDLSDDADFVVAFVTGDLSYGTIQEIVYSYLAGKPVFIIVSNGHEGHPWLKYHATKIFTNTANFKEYILKVNNDHND